MMTPPCVPKMKLLLSKKSPKIDKFALRDYPSTFFWGSDLPGKNNPE